MEQNIERYLFNLNKELLDLRALEMDKTMKRVLEDAGPNDGKIEFFNEKGESKTFTVNSDEGILQGRGIKGFFAPYDSEYLFMEKLPDGGCKVAGFPRIVQKWLGQFDISAENRTHMSEVVTAMNGMYHGDEKWFELYHMAREYFVDSEDGELICLPHLRDLDMYQYQIKTVLAAIKRFRGRLLFCDEVGLGKTVEAGMTMMEYIMRGMVKKILVLVPPSLVDQWYYEMKRKFNQDFIRADDPEFKEMGDKAWQHYGKVIASISTAKRKNNSEIISKIQYDLVIVDEAHHLKNRKTMAWQFINSLQKKYIFLLTATPVQNSLEELYNLITLLKPGQLKTYSYFKKNFVGDSEGMEAKNVGRLRELLSGVMIRNKRSDVDIRFTRRKASTLSVALSPEEQKLYDEISSFVKERYKSEGTGLSRFILKSLQEEMGSSFMALLSTLEKLSFSDRLEPQDRQQLAYFLAAAKGLTMSGYGSSPKIRQLHRILEEFGDKMLIFTKYKATQEFIVDYLKQHGYAVAEFHGGLKRKEKEAQIEFFKNEARVLVSTEAGGEGRNLQFCNGMVNFDLPWNPMAIEQRIGRIHRVGQTRDVFVYNLAAKNTVEYYILDLLDRKINMFELVVGEVDMILGDVEEEGEFSQLIMDAWVRSDDATGMEKEMDKLGEILLENKKQYLKIKELDENLFKDSFESSGSGG